jgi:hypothetical protein
MMHLEFVAQGHNPGIKGKFLSFLEVSDDISLFGEETRRY